MERKSYWSKTVELPDFPSLEGDRKVEVAVIGAGMAGLLTAYYLRKQGIEAVVLEAEKVASGQTRNTTAKITAQHGLIYHKLLDTLGEEVARQYADANAQAICAYQAVVQKEKIDCKMTEKPAYLYSLRETEPLKREAEAAKKLGFQADFTTQTELPFPIKGAARFDGQAHFHPLAFIKGILPGLEIKEHTPVKRVENNRIYTDRGVVTADKVVFATHYPFPLTPGYYFLRMHQERSYVLALEGAGELTGMYLGVDEDAGWSLVSQEKTLFLGGGSHRTGENKEGGKYAALRQKAKEFWPDAQEVAHWSAQDCMTLDGVPYIGQFSSSQPDWYVATGFGKWGMTSSMAAAQMICDAITGRENAFSQAFSPLRFTPSASAKAFFQEGAHAVRDLSRQVFAPAREEIEKLPEGRGGIVELEGEKVGVYKDEQGETYIVSVKCPHLGCQLEWNPDEKSWDCPCHGSRFDYRGNLLDNPAQEDLQIG